MGVRPAPAADLAAFVTTSRLRLTAVGTTALWMLAGCGGGSSEPPPQTQLDPRCPSVTASAAPALPPGRQPSGTPREALDEALAHKAFGVRRPKSDNGYYDEQTAATPGADTDLVYFVHYVIRKPDYEFRVAKTSNGKWFYAGESRCVSSPFQR